MTKTEIAQGYDAIADRLQMSPKFYRLCASMVLPKLHPGQRLIDLGCGQGRLLAEFQARNSQVQYCGLDLSFRLAAMTRQRVYGSLVAQGDLEHLPFSDAQFDAVLMTEVLEHLPSPPRALAEVSRILKPRGWLLLTMPNRDWYRYERYQTERKRYQPVDDHWYSVAEARGFLTGAGFSEQCVRGAENLYFGGGLPRLFEKLAIVLNSKLRLRMKRVLFLVQKMIASKVN